MLPDECARRIVNRLDCKSPDEAKVLAERTNKLRANFYNFYTDKRWGAAESYDLTFDSSLIPIEEIADMVIDYVHRRLDK